MKNKIIENIRKELSQLEDIEQAPCECCGALDKVAYRGIEVGEEYYYIQYDKEMENFKLITQNDNIALRFERCPNCGRKL